MRTRKAKIRYVSLESSKFLTDIDFMKMTPEERGVYCTLIFSLYEKGGYIEFNDNLAYLCNCQIKKFGTIWKTIENKFGKSRNKIFHKKVLKEIAIARTRSQMLTNKALMMNEKRWNGKNDLSCKESLRSPNENVNETRSRTRSERDVNENETRTRSDAIKKNLDSLSNENFSPDSISSRKIPEGKTTDVAKLQSRGLKFADFLNKNLAATTQSDRTSFNNVIEHLMLKCQSGYYTTEIFDKATELVKEAKKGSNPNALFMSLARKFLGYSRKTKEVES